MSKDQPPVKRRDPGHKRYVKFSRLVSALNAMVFHRPTPDDAKHLQRVRDAVKKVRTELRNVPELENWTISSVKKDPP